MIDTDASTNGLTLMYLKETRMQAELAASQRRVPRGIFETPTDSPREIVSTPIGAPLIPATYSFTNTELVSTEDFSKALEYTLASVRDEYDFIFLDAQAGADRIAYIAMNQTYSDEVILVSEYDPLSAAGIERLKGLFREDLTYVRTWVLLNKMLPDFVKSFSDFMEVAKYASPIPWDADVVRAYARRKLAIDTETGNEFTLAVAQSLRSIFGDEIEKDLDSWLETKASMLREPIETQVHDLEYQLRRLLEERDNTLKFKRYSELNKLTLFSAPIILLIAIISTLYKSWLPMNYRIILDIGTIVAILGVVSISAGVYFRESYRSKSNPLSEARFERQFRMLQDHLTKLEALKSANAETLLKNRSRLNAYSDE
jgi:cellulose biosynthesis protein BcsQ